MIRNSSCITGRISIFPCIVLQGSVRRAKLRRDSILRSRCRLGQQSRSGEPRAADKADSGMSNGATVYTNPMVCVFDPEQVTATLERSPVSRNSPRSRSRSRAQKKRIKPRDLKSKEVNAPRLLSFTVHFSSSMRAGLKISQLRSGRSSLRGQGRFEPLHRFGSEVQDPPGRS